MKEKINKVLAGVGGMLLFAMAAVVLNYGGAGGCGGGTTALACTGTSCDCPSGESCDITDSACGGDSCSLECLDNNECTGECGASCSVDCSGGSICDLTVGQSGSVTCTSDSECHVTCTGTCSVSCADGAVCDLLCPGDDAPKPVEGGANCAI